MIYVKRDAKGQVTAISKEPMEGFEQTDDGAASEIEEMLASSSDSLFQNSDLEFIRVLDDVIDLLISKNLVLFTELPEVVQEKYTQRTQMRERRRDSLNLLEDEEILYFVLVDSWSRCAFNTYFKGGITVIQRADALDDRVNPQ